MDNYKFVMLDNRRTKVEL